MQKILSLGLFLSLFVCVNSRAADEAIAPTSQETGEFSAVMDALKEAIRDNDSNAIGNLIDAQRLVEELQKRGALTDLKPQIAQQVQQRMTAALARGLTMQAQVATWEWHEIRHVEISPKRDEAVIVARTRDQDGFVSKSRWWLCKRDGKWLIYDFEELDWSMRLSSYAIAVAGQGRDRISALAPKMLRLIMAVQEIAEEDVASARKRLEELSDVTFDPTTEGLRWLCWGSVALGEYDPRLALEHYDRAVAVHSDMPIVEYMRAWVLNQLGEHDKALLHATKYEKMLGGDWETYLEIGTALENLGQLAAAADAYRKGLSDDPESTENLIGLARVLPAENKIELADHFAKLKSPEDVFYDIASSLDDEAQGKALAVICQAYRDKGSDDADLYYYLARADIHRGQPLRAAQTALESLDEIDPDEREVLLDAYCDAMLAAKQPLEAYGKTPDNRYVFEYVGDELIEAEDADTLARWIELHQSADAEDPWLPYYVGNLHLLRKEYDKAQAALSEGLAAAEEKVHQGAMRYSLVEARFHLGEGQEAYRDIEPKDETFEQLAEMYSDANDAEGLKKLIALRQTDAPDDGALTLWQAEVHYLSGDYPTAVATLEPHLDRLLSGDDYSTVQDRLIRALARSGQKDAAIARLKEWNEDSEFDPWYWLVVQSVTGNVEQTRREIERCLYYGYTLDELYDDPDIGLALRSDAMRPVREKYSPPATE